MGHCFSTSLQFTQRFVADIFRWAVGLGRYAFEKVSKAPNGQLIPVRNRVLRVKHKSWPDCDPNSTVRRDESRG